MAQQAQSSAFYSDQMVLCHMYLPADAAYECMSEIGELGQVQFRDLNPTVNAFQRKFVSEIRRADEMERQLRFIMTAMEKDGIKVADYKDNPRAPPAKEMMDMEARFQKLEEELKEINANGESLRQTYLELMEMKYILEKAQRFFDEKDESVANEDVDINLIGSSDRGSLSFVAGVIYRERVPNFERMLWRISHGNMLLRHSPIEEALEEPHSGELVQKDAFVVFFQGEQLKARVKKVCAAFHGTIHPLSESQTERLQTLAEVLTRLQDLAAVRSQTEDHRCRLLAAAALKIKTWLIKVRKIKAIYHMLNMCNVDVTARCLIAECWCPVVDLEKIQDALQRGKQRSGTEVSPILQTVKTHEVPPTYNRTNKFTAGFQNIIDAYGVATYQEANPMPYTVITFPFLFAVMFGDAGHGFIMMLFALFLIMKERQLAAAGIKDEIFTTFFGGRYIIVLMGIFSIYTGLIYNDVFSKSINVFGSGWTSYCNGSLENCFFDKTSSLAPRTNENFTNPVYPFGLDPVWQVSANKIPFTNSYKMKLSIVLGVLQMMFGVFVSLYNHISHKNYLNIVCEFIPQLLFLSAIFGYLVVTIIGKWLTNYNCDGCVSPSLLLMLINMFMFTHDPAAEMYPGQGSVETILVIMALICVPWMLFSKPLVLRERAKRRQRFSNVLERAALVSDAEAQDGRNGSLSSVSTTADEKGEIGIPEPSAHKPEEKFDFGDVMINQIIHTIEYCLGSVSHTASYLRLWALSLAHAQLSEVLWSQLFRGALANDSKIGFIMVYCLFGAWGVLTIGILLVMEGLSAFLHALRLHWVEFQSKFYHGEGYAFTPFRLQKVMDADDD